MLHGFRLRRIIGFLVATATAVAACGDVAADGDVLDGTELHSIEVEFSDDDYEQMITSYVERDDKTWIEATVTIDGSRYEQAGIRLKGNNSLAALRTGSEIDGERAADVPERLPWLVRLDHFLVGQDHDGVTELVIRSNTTRTSMNEAVALELFGLAGLATQDAMAVAFSVNDGEPALRLAVEHPDGRWMARTLSAGGALFKARSGGDYSYRGQDPDAYDGVFEQKAGADVTDLEPVMDLLRFVDEVDDRTFAADLDERLDVDAFATYLAMQDLVFNDDDIDGRGNNSYLYFDARADRLTVLNWDLNLAFGGRTGLLKGPDRMPDDAGHLSNNPLVERFLATPDFAGSVDDARSRLRHELIDSGVAVAVLDRWTAMLRSDATHLVPESVIDDERTALAAFLG